MQVWFVRLAKANCFYKMFLKEFTRKKLWVGKTHLVCWVEWLRSRGIGQSHWDLKCWKWSHRRSSTGRGRQGTIPSAREQVSCFSKQQSVSISPLPGMSFASYWVHQWWKKKKDTAFIPRISCLSRKVRWAQMSQKKKKWNILCKIEWCRN